MCRLFYTCFDLLCFSSLLGLFNIFLLFLNIFKYINTLYEISTINIFLSQNTLLQCIQHLIYRIYQVYQIYQMLCPTTSTGTVLDEWMDEGGADLCLQFGFMFCLSRLYSLSISLPYFILL